MEYYIKNENTGEHGLCKIGEGDWLDSVNRAGISGRGESVMMTNQVIIALTYMLEIISRLKEMRTPVKGCDIEELSNSYGEKRKEFKDNLRKHAFNKKGYFSSVFNDDGKWLFSDSTVSKSPSSSQPP
jgi:cellobiose phosphorylase